MRNVKGATNSNVWLGVTVIYEQEQMYVAALGDLQAQVRHSPSHQNGCKLALIYGALYALVRWLGQA